MLSLRRRNSPNTFVIRLMVITFIQQQGSGFKISFQHNLVADRKCEPLSLMWPNGLSLEEYGSHFRLFSDKLLIAFSRDVKVGWRKRFLRKSDIELVQAGNKVNDEVIIGIFKQPDFDCINIDGKTQPIREKGTFSHGLELTVGDVVRGVISYQQGIQFELADGHSKLLLPSICLMGYLYFLEYRRFRT